MKSVWKQPLEQLQAIRSTDLLRMETHLRELTVLDQQHQQLLTQLILLRKSYYALNLAKVHRHIMKTESDRQLARMSNEAESLLGTLEKEQECLAGELKTTKLKLRIKTDEYVAAERTLRVLECEVQEKTKEQRQLHHLHTHKSQEGDQLVKKIISMETQNDGIRGMKERAFQANRGIEEDLGRMRRHIEFVSVRQQTLSQKLSQALQLTEQAQRQALKSETAEKATLQKISELELKNCLADSQLRAKENRLAQLRSIVGRKKSDLEQQIKRSLGLQSDVADLSAKSETKKWQLDSMLQQVANLEKDNLKQERDNWRTNEALKRCKNHFENLRYCSEELVSAIESSLAQDIKARSILFGKIDSFKRLQYEYSNCQLFEGTAGRHSEAKLSGSRSTQMSEQNPNNRITL